MQERITHISCDGCDDAQYEDFGTAKEAREELSKAGWVNCGALDYCPKCKNTARAKKRQSIFDPESTQ